MSGNFKKDDLRVIKTHEALLSGLQRILNRRSFARITVNDICEEAQLSRSAFYAHFQDKYDLLEKWMRVLKFKLKTDLDNYNEFACSVNGYLKENSKVVVNILADANNETLVLVKSFFAYMLGLHMKMKFDKVEPIRNVVACHFCTGGILNWLYWQIENDFPEEVPFINADFFSIVKNLVDLVKL